jgi:hypothetical protein
MWLFDKIKNGYKRTVNKFLGWAVRTNSVRMAKVAIYMGADPFVWGYNTWGIVYPLLKHCNSREMFKAIVGDSDAKLNQILIFAAQQNLNFLANLAIGAGANPETLVGPNMPLILSPLPERTQETLFYATMHPKNTSPLHMCFKWFKNVDYDATKHTNIIKWASKIAENSFADLNYIDPQTKNTVLHELAYCPALTFEGVPSLLDKVLWRAYSQIHNKNVDGMTPLDLMNNSPHRKQWREKLEALRIIKPAVQAPVPEQPQPLITDRYASMKGEPMFEHLVAQSSEDRIFFTKNSNKM